MENVVLKRKSLIVIVITLITMFAEIYFGIKSHSMSLTADGFHMGTHAIALLVTFCLCVLAIKFKEKTEKLNALGGYTSAVLLGFTSLGIIYESVVRFIKPLPISFEEAILVAIIGLIVNLACVVVMWEKPHDHHFECHEDEYHENLNYKAAYMHIMADVLTSVLAIGALFIGKYFGLTILDPVIGLFGGFIIAKWAFELIKSSSKILLEMD